MAYLGYCEQCHYLYADVTYSSVEQILLRHSAKSHSDSDERIVIVCISAREYQDYLANKDNPAFWTAWRLAKKTVKIPVFV